MSQVTPEPRIRLFNIEHFCASSVHYPIMLSPEEIAQIKEEIERLEKLREICTDRSIRERIEAWIKAEKKKLEPQHSKR